jgi:predicted dienelactone hydrolase
MSCNAKVGVLTELISRGESMRQYSAKCKVPSRNAVRTPLKFLFLAFLPALLIGFLETAETSAKTVESIQDKTANNTGSSSTCKLKVIEDAVLADGSRGKKLPIKITYPDAAGKFPLIIFSHGAGGSKDGYSRLIDFWSQHGYVCIQPTHADSFRLRREQGEQITDLLRPSDREQGWIDRILDIKLILDSLPTLEQTYPELAGKIDKTKIGMGGHSFGALTSEIICGAQVPDPSVDAKSIHDARLKAVLLLSPSGVSEHPKLTQDSWNQMRIPMMVMSGTYDRGRLGQDSSWRTQPYVYSPAGSKYLVFIKNGSHMVFSGDIDNAKKLRKVLGNGPDIANLTGPDIPPKEYESMFNEVKLASLTFWDDFLKGDKRARAYLDQGGLSQDSSGVAEVSHR